MPKQPNRFGGGAQTNANGLYFEQTTSLDDALYAAGYQMQGRTVYYDGEKIGLSVPQKKFYTYFLEPNGIDYSDYNSKEWRPDEAFVNFTNKTVYIIEKKFQNTPGSVDEKLPSCDFKKWEYTKLCAPLGFDVEFIYIFNDWFLDRRYSDTLEYIEEVGCYYFYNEIPLEALGLQNKKGRKIWQDME
ncbi:MAG: hypothetical protein J1E03_04535 [Acetatifactor sp.]|nr:hypothetical protein [Acetatifactor sp.]